MRVTRFEWSGSEPRCRNLKNAFPPSAKAQRASKLTTQPNFNSFRDRSESNRNRPSRRSPRMARAVHQGEKVAWRRGSRAAKSWMSKKGSCRGSYEKLRNSRACRKSFKESLKSNLQQQPQEVEQRRHDLMPEHQKVQKRSRKTRGGPERKLIEMMSDFGSYRTTSWKQNFRGCRQEKKEEAVMLRKFQCRHFAGKPSAMSSFTPLEFPKNSLCWTAKTTNIVTAIRQIP